MSAPQCEAMVTPRNANSLASDRCTNDAGFVISAIRNCEHPSSRLKVCRIHARPKTGICAHCGQHSVSICNAQPLVSELAS